MSSTANIEIEQRLLERYREHGDRAARDQLADRMTPLVRSVASRYHVHGQEDDLVQVAWVGLVKAIDRYDPAHRVPLRSYAVPTMHGELRRYLRDQSWSVRPPRPLQERVLAVTRATERLTSSDGCSPTPRRVADELRLDVEDVLEALQAGSAYASVSLDAPAQGSVDGSLTIAEAIGQDDGRLEIIEHLAALGDLRDVLGDGDRQMLHLRFARDMSQREIGRVVGCSQMQVSRVLRRVLSQLRERVEQPASPPDRRLRSGRRCSG